MAWRCTHCGLRDFEADDARCPQCLRKGGLVDLATPMPDEQRQWGKILLLLAINVLFGGLAFFGVWDLTERSAAQSWPVTFANVTGLKHKRLRCEIDYAFTIGGKKFEGHTTQTTCPTWGEDVMVSYFPDDPERHRVSSGVELFLDLFGVGFGAFGLAGIGGVLLYMLFPRHDGLRRYAARVGSKDARAALARR